MNLSIVTTLYRSAPYLNEFYTRASVAAQEITENYEIIFVNDGSPDNSLDVVLELFETDSKVKVIDLSRNFGHHKAMMTGLAHANGELVYLLDSDLEEEPELLSSFHNILQETRSDVVYGVQQQRKGSIFEQVTGNIFYHFFNWVSSYPVPNNIVTARLMTQRYVQALVQHQDKEVFLAGLWAITGFKQVPLIIKKHSKSSSTYDLRRKISVFVNSITSFSNKPLIFIFYAGSIILFLSGLAAINLIIRRVVFGTLLTGWLSLIVSIWMIGGLTLFCLGVIGIYLAKMFSETKQRPYTVIRQVYESVPNKNRSDSLKESTSNFSSICNEIGQYYTGKLDTHGATAKGVDWNSPDSQTLRFKQLLKVCDDVQSFSLNDYGCGYGALANFLQNQDYAFQYTGYDVSEAMIAKAKELHPNWEHCRFTEDKSSLTPADYTVASGIFNVRLQNSIDVWEKYIHATVHELFLLSSKGFSFNVLTKYSDPERMRSDLYYADPGYWFDYCKRNLSKNVAVLHDYDLYEFTVIVKK